MTSVLLAGAGPMAISYARVLQALDVAFLVVGRGEQACRSFESETGVAAAPGGIHQLRKGDVPSKAIVAVSVGALADATLDLLRLGVADILVEKPGGLSAQELAKIASAADNSDARVNVAYNRRYYASTERARELIAADGGAKSFTFEFTEWADRVLTASRSPASLSNWFLANSSHVVDLAFYLGGEPVELSAFTAADDPAWGRNVSVFSGSGRTAAGALFSYTANWSSPGRWGVEIMTRRRRLILRPLELLLEQRHGSLTASPVPIDDAFDKAFKPGIYRQTRDFVEGRKMLSPTIDEQVRAERDVYRPMVEGSG